VGADIECPPREWQSSAQRNDSAPKASRNSYAASGACAKAETLAQAAGPKGPVVPPLPGPRHNRPLSACFIPTALGSRDLLRVMEFVDPTYQGLHRDYPSLRLVGQAWSRAAAWSRPALGFEEALTGVHFSPPLAPLTTAGPVQCFLDWRKAFSIWNAQQCRQAATPAATATTDPIGEDVAVLLQVSPCSASALPPCTLCPSPLRLSHTVHPVPKSLASFTTLVVHQPR